MKTVSKADRAIARRVVSYYLKQAQKEVEAIDQEKPSAWLESLTMTKELLSKDPDKVFRAYKKEYDAGHSPRCTVFTLFDWCDALKTNTFTSDDGAAFYGRGLEETKRDAFRRPPQKGDTHVNFYRK